MEGKLGRAGEVRRLHIIYFLTHLGHSEHPHLIRVHHLTRTGVYLRDVKRWLGDLRGKDMPETYAWSYKRRYKSGYVWQDLLDDDLITPLSDNEYVLKGSEIISTPIDAKTDINAGSYSCVENKAVKTNNTTTGVVDDQDEKVLNKEASCKKSSPDPKINHPPITKTFSEINEESWSSSFGSEMSTLTDEFDSVKLENDNHLDSKEQQQQQHNKPPAQKIEIPPPLYCNLPLTDKKSKNKNRKKNQKKRTKEWGEMGGTLDSSSSSSSKSPLPAKRKSFSGGASNVLRSFITCRAVDTNDTVLVLLNHGGGSQRSTASEKLKTKRNDNHSKGQDEIFKGGHMGRSFRTCWSPHPDEEVQKPQMHSARRSYDERAGSTYKQQQSEFNTKQRAIPTAYRPVREPNCSQCGKAFKPEKMHSHMKSCKGMKSLANRSNFNRASSAASVEKNTVLFSQKGSTTSSYKESSLGHFLTN